MKKRHPLRPLMILIVIILFLAILYFVALFAGQKYLTRYVNESVQEVSFTSIDISPLQGEVELDEFVFDDGEVSLTSSLLVLSVNSGELFDLITGSRELSFASLAAENLSVAQGTDSFTADSVNIEISGRLSLESPEASVITHASVTLVNGEASTEGEAVAFKTSYFHGEAFGVYDHLSEIDSLGAVLSRSEKVSVNCETPEITLSSQMRESLASQMPLSSWLTDADSFKGDHLNISASFPEDRIEVEDLSLSFPILEAKGEGTFYPDNPSRIRISLEVSHLADAIRNELNPLLMFFFKPIPEGAFRFDLDMSDPLSPPRVVFESI